MVLQNRDVDQFEILAVAASRPEALSQLNPMASRRCETRVGDILIKPIAILLVIVSPKDGSPDGVEQGGRDPRIMTHGIDEVEKTMALIIGVGVNGVVRVAPPSQGIAVKAPLALPILEDDHFACKTIGMVQNSPNQPPDEVAVGTATILPLGIHLDQNDIVGRDHSRRTAERSLVS